MGFSLLLIGEPMQGDTSPSSEMRVTGEIGFLKGYRAAEPDRLSPFFFKDDDKMLTLEYTKFVR